MQKNVLCRQQMILPTLQEMRLEIWRVTLVKEADKSETRSDPNLGLIAGIAALLTVVLLVIVAVIAVCCCKKKS